MRIRSILLLGLGAALSSPNVLADDSRFELSDGSVLRGEVVGFANGRYRIESATLGKVWVPQSRIRSIHPCADCDPGSPSVAPAIPDYRTRIDDIQRRLVADGKVIESISTLQNDPAIRAVLEDPELMRRILSGDIEGLRTDPKIGTLMQHPEIRALIDAY